MEIARVPMDSPAWQYYIEQGWTEVRKEGLWVILRSPPVTAEIA